MHEPHSTSKFVYPVAELKLIILNEWDKITMDEIKARISEMPKGCMKLIQNERREEI